jgi:aryl-alcohol dehydrogenase-like predicted oxidoreductase
VRLALGTVQFGLSYGIANSTGQVVRSEALDILNYAKNVGIDTIDTAIAYGESEQRLGEIGVNDWHVITKLPEIPNNCQNLTQWIESRVSDSLGHLGVQTLSGLLLHRPSQLLDLGKEALWPTLLKLKSDGVVEKIGFSIYSPDELDKLWSVFKPDLVQAPYSIFDRRLITSGWLERMNEEGVEVHARSIFLQGLLLMDKNSRPEKFDKWSKLWKQWDGWLQENCITSLQATVSFALSDSRISRVVVGVDSLSQFKEILSAEKINISDFPEELSITDLNLLNPSQWGLL